jgi:hypothetical protein
VRWSLRWSLGVNICKRHWDALRARISQLGLDRLIAHDGDAAAKRLTDQRPENFDPLLCAWQMIVRNAAAEGIVGGCYVCFGEEHAKACDKPPDAFCAARTGYIELAARDTETEAIRLGYRPTSAS